jgi:branched-chain amino acid transport system substrate-binding protein
MSALRRREFVAAAAATAGIAGLAGCTGGGGSTAARQIGLPTPQSGPLAPSGTAGVRGARVAIEEANESLDEPIELEFKDGQASPETARSVVQEMLDADVPVVTGTFSSDVSNALSEFAEREEFPFMTAVSGDAEITSPEDDWTFRMSANTYQQLKATMEFFNEMETTKIAILAADYSFGRSVLEYMGDHASDFGLEMVHDSLIPLSTNNFVPELRQVDTDEVEAVLYPFPGGNSPTLIKQSREQGFFEDLDVVMGFNAHASEVYKQSLGSAIEGLYTWSVDLENQRAQAASERMMERFDVPMDALSLPNYDAVHLIVDAMESADSFDRQGIRDAIADTDYETASGYPVQFNDAGDNTQYRMVVGRWQQEGDRIRNVPQYTTDTLSPEP